MSIALQSDDNNRFYRAFIGLPIATKQHHVAPPLLFFDSYHYRCPQYDGKIVGLCSKSGDGSIIDFGFGVVPAENANHLAWFLQMCALHNTDFNCALFTDRGPLTSAVKLLTQHTKLEFSLMFCLQRLKRNVRHRFPLLFSKAEPNRVMSRSLEAASDTMDLQMFMDCFCIMFQISIRNKDSEFDIDVAKYIFGMHPSHWTVLGNSVSFDEGKFTKSINKMLQQLHAAKLLKQQLNLQRNDDEPIRERDKHHFVSLIETCNSQSLRDAPTLTTREIF